MIKWQIVMVLCLAASSVGFLIGMKFAFLISEAKVREIYGPGPAHFTEEDIEEFEKASHKIRSMEIDPHADLETPDEVDESGK